MSTDEKKEKVGPSGGNVNPRTGNPAGDFPQDWKPPGQREDGPAIGSPPWPERQGPKTSEPGYPKIPYIHDDGDD